MPGSDPADGVESPRQDADLLWAKNAEASEPPEKPLAFAGVAPLGSDEDEVAKADATPPTDAVDPADPQEKAPATPVEDLAGATEGSTSDSTETPQTVDSEAESRILPRSE